MARAKPVKLIDPENARITLFGCGGTGGALLQTLCRLIYGLHHDRRGRFPREPRTGYFREDPKTPLGVPTLLIVDGDTVEEKNLLRQPFVPKDLGRKKAIVLAERLGAAYGIDVSAYPHYVGRDTPLETLVEPGGIAVGCVDNTPTRALLHHALSAYDDVIYIDAGNAGVPLPDPGNPAPETREERLRIREGGWEGQVACGVNKKGRNLLPFPGEVFPDLIDVTEGDEPLPTEARCGDVVQSLPQRHLTNLMAATVLMAFITSLLTEGTLLHHVSFFDARQCYVRSTAAIDLLEDVAA